MLDEQLRKDFEELFSTDNEWIKGLNGSSILITGSTGLIGSVIARALLFYNDRYNGNITVVCHARNKNKADMIYNDWLNNNRLDFCFGNIDNELIYNGNIDYIIHGANTTSSKEYVEKPVETIKSIINGTENVLRFALIKNVKSIVYLSSMEVYGSVTGENLKLNENDGGFIDPMSVRSSYSEGKRLAECLCASFSSEYGIKTIVARLAQVFGAGVSINDNRVFMQLAKCAINHTDFIMRSDGSSYGNYCYTTDAVKALLILLKEGKNGEAYNIVNENNTSSIKEMAEMVANDIADNSFKIVYDIPKSNMKYGYAPKTRIRLSAEKMRALKWQAEINLQDMYKRMINSLIK